jgi:hypothetical protein
MLRKQKLLERGVTIKTIDIKRANLPFGDIYSKQIISALLADDVKAQDMTTKTSH